MTVLNLGCGTDQHEDAVNVDALSAVNPDRVVDLESYPWPWDDNSIDAIRMFHVLEHLESIETALSECQRILKPGGSVCVKWPMGMNERADPDHKHTWVWDTPEMYCGKRPWDADTGLTVSNRSVSVHPHLSGAPYYGYRAVIAAGRRLLDDGRWLFDLPATSGEFTVIFRNHE